MTEYSLYYCLEFGVHFSISGSISNDLQPGDVFVPDSVKEYFANASVTGKAKLNFVPSGNQLSTDPRLLNRFQLFHINHSEYFSEWKHHASSNLSLLISDKMLDDLAASNIEFRSINKIIAGDERILASGPAVGKGDAFVKWLKGSTRKSTAVEMESAGVYDASFIRTPPPRTIAIHGISDFGDDRKDLVESITKGQFRVLSIKNAASLLRKSIEAGIFA